MANVRGFGKVVRPGTPEFDALVEGVIHQESRGNPNAYNAVSGASGLMQVMPDTARSPGFGVRPLDWSRRFDAKESKRFGTQYLGAMLARYDGNVDKALAAYNWGPGNADKWNGDVSRLPAETRDYITKIRGRGGNVDNGAAAGTAYRDPSSAAATAAIRTESNADAPPPSDYDMQAVQAPSTAARPERPNGFALLAQLRAQTGQGYFGISSSTPLSSMAGRAQATPTSVTPASGAARASIVS